MSRVEEYPSIAVVCYVRHKKKPAESVKEATEHVTKCKECQKAFNEEARKRAETPSGRGWWTGDDPYLAELFGTLK